MTSVAICVLVFVLTCWAGRRALWLGIAVVVFVGYSYGLARAHLADATMHLLFDASVAGLYASCLWSAIQARNRARLHDLKLWTLFLIAWPTLLFLFHSGDMMIELVGWRANVFLVPCLLIGAQLNEESLYKMSLVLAALNIAAALLGALEFTFGIDVFIPYTEATDILYRSRLSDQESIGLRIPASFVNAHAYGGTMVMTLPFLFGAWIDPRARWQKHMVSAALVASLLGVFMAGARTPMIVLVLLVTLVTLSRQIPKYAWASWIVVMGIVASVVWREGRLQRFVSLRDTEYLAERLGGSVNHNFFDLMSTYPFGQGLAGGGTSIPYFLQDRFQGNFVIENEFARIVMEQGIPGLFLWILFMLWVMATAFGLRSGSWQLTRRLVLANAAAYFVLSLTGIGLLTSIPQSMILLLGIGWAAVRQPASLPAGETVATISSSQHCRPEPA